MEVTEFDVEEETGTRVPVKAADPNLPTPEEVDTHISLMSPTGLGALIASEGKVRLWTTGALGEIS